MVEIAEVLAACEDVDPSTVRIGPVDFGDDVAPESHGAAGQVA